MEVSPYNLVITVSGTLIMLLASVLWWFVRDKMKSRSLTEDRLDKRLSDGAATMSKLRDSVISIQQTIVEQAGKTVHKPEFDGYCQSHRDEHKALDTSMTKLREGQIELGYEVSQLGDRLGNQMATIHKLLAEKTTIGEKKTIGDSHGDD